MEGFQILIVEDYSPSLKALADFMHEEFPTTRIDTATSRQEALRLVTASIVADSPYDLVIADLLLPDSMTGTPEEYKPEFKKEFFRQIWQDSNSTALLLMTAFEDNSEVKAHYAAMDELPNSRYRKFTKRAGYTLEILKVSRDILFGDLILGKIRGIVQDTNRGRFYQPQSGFTTQFREIRSDIRAYWRFLSDETKTRIRQYITVSESPGPALAEGSTQGDIDVSLFPTPEAAENE